MVFSKLNVVSTEMICLITLDCIDAYVQLIRTLGMKIGWQNVLTVLGCNMYEYLQIYYMHR